jgi:hypothetical protein
MQAGSMASHLPSALGQEATLPAMTILHFAIGVDPAQVAEQNRGVVTLAFCGNRFQAQKETQDSDFRTKAHISQHGCQLA